MRLLAPALSLAALVLTACAVQTPQEQLAPASPTVRLCEGNNCSELPRNVATFRGEPVNPEAERRLAASNARIGAAISEYYPKLSLAGLVGSATSV